MSGEPKNPFGDLRAEWIAAGLLSPDAPLAKPMTEEERAEHVQAIIKTQRLVAFKEQCPAQFRAKIDLSLIPNLTAWKFADEWMGTFPGPWIWSPESGRGKTRMLWRKFGQLHCELGRSVLKVSGQALAEEYFRFHMEKNPRAFYRWITAYDVVMLDDLDKMDLGVDRVPRMCRELFDEFYSRKSIVLVTANEPISHFEELIGLSTSRRIHEVTQEIKF